VSFESPVLEETMKGWMEEKKEKMEREEAAKKKKNA
jgi:hypothetical protein